MALEWANKCSSAPIRLSIHTLYVSLPVTSYQQLVAMALAAMNILLAAAAFATVLQPCGAEINLPKIQKNNNNKRVAVEVAPDSRVTVTRPGQSRLIRSRTKKHNSMPVQELPKRESPQTESLPNNMSKQKEGSTSKASQSVLLRREELVDKRQLLEAVYGAGAVADKLFAPELMEAVHVVSDSGSMTTVRLAPCAAACVAFFSEYDPSIVGLGDDENEDDDDDDDNDDDSKGEGGGGAEAGEIGEGVAGTNSVGGAFDFGEYFGVEDDDEDIRMHRRLHAAAVKVQSVVRMRSLQVGVRKLVPLPPLYAACVSFGFCCWCFRC